MLLASAINFHKRFIQLRKCKIFTLLATKMPKLSTLRYPQLLQLTFCLYSTSSPMSDVNKTGSLVVNKVGLCTYYVYIFTFFLDDY